MTGREGGEEGGRRTEAEPGAGTLYLAPRATGSPVRAGSRVGTGYSSVLCETLRVTVPRTGPRPVNRMQWKRRHSVGTSQASYVPSRYIEMKSSNQHGPAHFAEIRVHPDPAPLTESLPPGFGSGPPPFSSHQGSLQASPFQICISEASQASSWSSVALTSLYLPKPFPCPPWLPAKLYSQSLLKWDGTV